MSLQWGIYQCSYCHCELQEGDPVIIIGRTPPNGLSAPIGRADVILEKVGDIYCERCFKALYKPEIDIKPASPNLKPQYSGIVDI